LESPQYNESNAKVCIPTRSKDIYRKPGTSFENVGNLKASITYREMIIKKNAWRLYYLRPAAWASYIKI